MINFFLNLINKTGLRVGWTWPITWTGYNAKGEDNEHLGKTEIVDQGKGTD